MIALAGLLILVAGALLVGGLGNGETTMLWGSVGVSALAAVVLVLDRVRRSRAARVAADDDEPLLPAEPVPAGARASSAAPSPARTSAAAPARVEAAPAADSAGAASGAAGAAAAPTAVPVEAAPSAAGTEAAPVPAVAATASSASLTEDDAPTVVQPAATGPTADVDAPATPPPAVVAENRAVAEPAVDEVAVDKPTVDKPTVDEAAVGAAAVATPVAAAPPVVGGPTTGSHAPRAVAALGDDGEPVEEDVVVTDLLLILDLTDEVEVVDEHPRYHLAGCSITQGADVFALPLNEAKEDGFTACGICRPDRNLADAERKRRAAAKA